MLWAIAAEHVRSAVELKQTHPNAMGWYPALAAIVFAAMAAEAHINEASHFICTRSELFPSPNPDPEAQRFFDAGVLTNQLEEDQARTTAKYMAMSSLLPGPSLTPGINPLQDLQTLFRIRNDLLHPRIRRTPHYVQQFRQQGMTVTAEQHELPIAGWCNQIQTPEIGRWACASALRAIKHLNEQIAASTSSSTDAIHKTIDFIVFGWDVFTEADERLRL